MIHGFEDLFVGVVAILLGLFFITVAAVNWQWYYTVRSARFLESKFGRTGARVVHALLGVALIGLGLAIAMGHRWRIWD